MVPTEAPEIWPGSETIAFPGIPEFHPKKGLKNPHLQTIVGAFCPGGPRIMGTIQRKLRFSDGDFAVIHDDKPPGWQRGDHVAFLMHGLAGCHRSGYMVRTASKLMERNVRVFRMDHRGCGAGQMLAKSPYHAGRIQDVAMAIQMLERLCPESPISMAGFSISANLLLRFLGDNPNNIPQSIFRAVAICPPIDLQHCVNQLDSTVIGRKYSRYFAKKLTQQVRDTPLWREDLPLAKAKTIPGSMKTFDELFTAPACGYENALEYYEAASARDHIRNTQVHTTVLLAADDPLIPMECWSKIRFPQNFSVCITDHGGHLGFMGRNSQDADNRWMDWRVVEWLLN
ncbi:MAG: alpha/beta fold hydrolase [Fuerstiella sp.]